MAEIKSILAEAVHRGASDVHINVGLRPIVRVNTELIETDFPPVSDEDATEIVRSLIGQDKFNTFEKRRDFDFSTSITDPDQRFRVNAHYQRDTVAISFRLISDRVPSIDELNLPEKIKEFADLPRGLVLVTGHTGAGKSTTLASTIGLINAKYGKRVITIEDPIEYWLVNDKCMIEQREVGSDCPDFATGLRHILRQDPDIIMVGEMRDLETTSFTLTAAETGHLVFSTLHTPNASQSIERVVDIYPANQQTQARTMLANALQAVVSQTLFRPLSSHRTLRCRLQPRCLCLHEKALCPVRLDSSRDDGRVLGRVCIFEAMWYLSCWPPINAQGLGVRIVDRLRLAATSSVRRADAKDSLANVASKFLWKG